MTDTWGWYCHRHSLFLESEVALVQHINSVLNQTHIVTGARRITGTLPLPLS